MLRATSEDMRVNLKDRLRDMRHVVRQYRHDSPAAAAPAAAPQARPPFPFREIEDLFGHAVSTFDDAMAMAQTLVRRTPAGGARTAKGFIAYFPPGARDGLAAERAFRRDMYALVCTVVARRGIGAVLVHEAAFAAVHAAVLQHRKPLLARLGRVDGAEKISLAAQLGAALLVELLARRPFRLAPARPFAPAPGGIARSDAIACLAPVALACALATVDGDGGDGSDLLDIAVLVTDARLERVLHACNGANPHAELTALFAVLLAHLP